MNGGPGYLWKRNNCINWEGEFQNSRYTVCKMIADLICWRVNSRVLHTLWKSFPYNKIHVLYFSKIWDTSILSTWKWQKKLNDFEKKNFEKYIVVIVVYNNNCCIQIQDLQICRLKLYRFVDWGYTHCAIEINNKYSWHNQFHIGLKSSCCDVLF